MMTLLFNLVLSGCVAALLFAAINLFSKRQYRDWAVNALLAAANVIQLVYIIWRWAEAGRPPFSNMFESLVLFAWTTVLVYLVIRRRLRVPVLGAAGARPGFRLSAFSPCCLRTSASTCCSAACTVTLEQPQALPGGSAGA